ncbi:MAG TPA: EVE domain-containing protein [Gammaproteobacteria bacterium]|nr:EVE domain-containing protein [Gammaproteobacteria bacterium]
MKSEPDVFGIAHLAKAPKHTVSWAGVRNYQVRNLLRDEIKKDDLAFFYHSSCPEPGVVGVMKVTRAAHPDTTQFDPRDEYFDPKSKREDPTWYAVDVTLAERFETPVLLQELRSSAPLKDLQTLRRGNRLSITSVTPAEWRCILKLAHSK